VTIEDEATPSDITLSLLSSPSIASKRWAFEQYDSVVGSRTVHRAGAADAAVLNIPESGRAIAISIDGNGRRVACDPFQGTIEATLEGAANLAVVGAEPLGVTNCLNFGNPEKPGVAWQLGRAVEGLAEACRALEAPVVGGNVSLYNETPQGPIYPTPVVGMVGELPDPEKVAGENWQEGDAVALVGPFDPSLAGSELEKQRGELGKGLPVREIGPVKTAIELVRDAVRSGGVRTATDVSDGGLSTALAELSISSGIGFEGELSALIARRDCSEDDALFGEGPGGFIIAGEPAELEKLGGQGVDFELIGEVGGNELVITAGNSRVEVLVEEAAAAFDSLEDRIESDQAGLTH
jgi:phosphoribosylformylglycinamidine synthase